MHPEPHTYDLCAAHARSLTAPRGWDLVRHDGDLAPPPPPPDDLLALAEAVREARHQGATAPEPGPDSPPSLPRGRGGHLRLIPPA
jgi:hypothetical protein